MIRATQPRAARIVKPPAALAVGGSPPPPPAQGSARDGRLIITGSYSQEPQGARIAGSQEALLSVSLEERLLLLISDGSLVSVQIGYHDDDYKWRVLVVEAGTAKAQVRRAARNACSDRLELTGPGLRIFAATSNEQYACALDGGRLRVADLVEPARLLENFLSFADPYREWVDEFSDVWSDPWNGIYPLRYVLAMRDALRGPR